MKSGPVHLPLLELVRRIGHLGDKAALDELVAVRAAFKLKNGRLMTFFKYIQSLSFDMHTVAVYEGATSLNEFARNLIADRLMVMPHDKAGPCPVTHRRTDCRSFYRAVYSRACCWTEEHPGLHPSRYDSATRKILQGMVKRRYRFACLEACRHCNPFRRRYPWRRDGRVIHVWMPKIMSRSECLAWLEDNIDLVDVERSDVPGEVQRMVDQCLGIPRFESVHESLLDPASPYWAEDPFLVTVRKEQAHLDLVTIIVDEVAAQVDRLRPAVRSLGRRGVAKLIRNMLRALDEETYVQKAIAAAHGLTEPTLGRFTGLGRGNGAGVADFLIIVARAVVNRPACVEMAREAGVWNRIEAILNSGSDKGR